MAKQKNRLSTITVPLSRLKLDPENKRRHGPDSIRAIAASLTALRDVGAEGQIEPLVVQKSTMRVMAGNGRLMAMRELGWTKCVVLPIDCTDEQAKLIGVLLNRTAEYSEWDDDAGEDLEAMIAELDDDTVAWIFEELKQELEQAAAKQKPAKKKQKSTKVENKKPNADATYVVIAECADEAEQAKVYDMLTKQKIKCRVSTLY